MANTTMIHVRMDVATKKAAEAIFDKLGLTMSDAIRMFLKAVKREKGLPVDVKIPSARLRRAMQDVEEGRVTKVKDWKEFLRMMEQEPDA